MIATSSATSAGERGATRWAGVRDLLGWIAGLCRTRRDRQQLAMLSDAMLGDIGLTRADVERELARPLWNGIDYAALEAARARAARCTGKARWPR